MCKTICLFSGSDLEGGMIETTVMPSRICNQRNIFLCVNGGRVGPLEETHAACYVGHRTNYRCAGKNPGGELRDGDAGKDADEHLASQSVFEPTLAEYGMRTLWFAADLGGR
jgi:hypothetical protein